MQNTRAKIHTTNVYLLTFSITSARETFECDFFHLHKASIDCLFEEAKERENPTEIGEKKILRRDR